MTLLSIFTNLAIGVIVGVLINALSYTYDSTAQFSMSTSLLTNSKEQVIKLYRCDGPLYFGCQRAFINMFSIATDPSFIIIDFTHSTVKDLSAI